MLLIALVGFCPKVREHVVAAAAVAGFAEGIEVDGAGDDALAGAGFGLG